MSIRSAANSNLVLNDLKINGTLTLAEPLVYEDFEVDNLDVVEVSNLNILNVSGTATIDELVVTGHTSLQDATATSLSVSANTTLDTVTTNGLVNMYGGLSVHTNAGFHSFTSSGASSVVGLTVTSGTTSDTLHVTGHSTLADVGATSISCTGDSQLQTCTVKGDLHVDGEIYGASQSNMEVLYYNLMGNGNSATETMTLHHNSANNTNYVVFPSIYYGYSGSGGTYNAQDSSSSLNKFVITNPTASSFSWVTTKTTGDNINVYIVFLVVYGVSSSNFPSSY